MKLAALREAIRQYRETSGRLEPFIMRVPNSVWNQLSKEFEGVSTIPGTYDFGHQTMEIDGVQLYRESILPGFRPDAVLTPEGVAELMPR